MKYTSNTDAFLNMIDLFSTDLIKNKNIEVVNIPCSFDIETSSFFENNEKRAIMYIWQFAFKDVVLYGRDWFTFLDFYKQIIKRFGICKNRKLIIYVHNLSYEFQFLRKWLKWSDVFATDNRKVLKCTTIDNVEFRCSYLLSGYSLETTAKNLTSHKIEKLNGFLDYEKIRHSKTELSESELLYCFNDVLIVNAYIDEQIKEFGNIEKIPLTQTGKVRRLIKNNMMKNKNVMNEIKKMTLTNCEFLELKRAFCGGFTHSSNLYTTQILQDVHSYDFTSSYPFVLLSEKFPMSKGKKINVSRLSEKDFYNYINRYCCLFNITIYGIRPKIRYENIISFSKCIECIKPIVNNGRLFSADKITITVNEIDFNSIKDFYSYDYFTISDLFIYEKNYLPYEFIKTVIELYKKKTVLKDVKGCEVEYLHSKENLNSLYGMCVTDIARDNIEYKNDEWVNNGKNIDKSVNEYNTNKLRFLNYAWGVWCTSYARKNLYSGIIEVGNDYIYSDTDSIKFFNIEKHKNYFETYNKNVIKKLDDLCCHYMLDINELMPKTQEGKIKIIGVWDYEGKYDLFKTLGAKRYMTFKNNELSFTISGVNKKFGVPFLLEKYNGNIEKIFEDFNSGLIFPKEYTGKNTHTYIDFEQKGKIKDYNGLINDYFEKSSIHLEKTDYNLSMNESYIDFLTGVKEL